MSEVDAYVVLVRCVSEGVTLEPLGDRLRIRAERRPPDELLEEIRSCKLALLSLLARRSDAEDLSEAEEIARRVEQEGICICWCEALQDTIAFILDASVPAPAGLVAYTSAELYELFGPGRPDLSPATLQRIHALKKEGGHVVPPEGQREPAA